MAMTQWSLHIPRVYLSYVNSDHAASQGLLREDRETNQVVSF